MFVTAGLDPGIHDFTGTRGSVSVENKKDVDGRVKPGHDALVGRTRRAPGCLAKRP